MSIKVFISRSRYFRQHEGSIDGRYVCNPKYAKGAWRALCGESLTRQPQEFVGKPGTVLLWHAWTVHSPSLNCRPEEPRVAVHLRYYDEQMRGGLVRHGMSGLPGDPGPGMLDPNAPGPEQQAQQLRMVGERGSGRAVGALGGCSAQHAAGGAAGEGGKEGGEPVAQFRKSFALQPLLTLRQTLFETKAKK